MIFRPFRTYPSQRRGQANPYRLDVRLLRKGVQSGGFLPEHGVGRVPPMVGPVNASSGQIEDRVRTRGQDGKIPASLLMAIPYARSSSTLEAKRVPLGTFPTMLRWVLITEVDSGHITQHLLLPENIQNRAHISRSLFF